MSKGNTKTYGNKGNNFPFQHNLLLINSAISAATAAGATEATLQLVLTALQNGQDYEAKLVRDSGVPPETWLEVRIYNPNTGIWDAPVYYPPGSVVPGAPTLPIFYIDPTTLLSQIVSNTTGLATQATVAAMEALLTTIDLDTSNLDVLLSTRASEVTLAATNVLLTTIDAVLDTIKTDTSAMVVDLAAIEVLQTSIQGLLTTIDADTGSILIDTNAMVVDLAAIEVLLTTIDGVLDSIKLDTANLDVALSTVATEVTAAAILADTAILSTGASRTVSATEYVAPGAQVTNAGVKAVIIICTTGLESIEGIVHPAGVYTFEPQKGEDTVGVININANTGRLIVDELS